MKKFNKNIFKACIASLVLACFLTTGCFGSFGLTRLLYNFNDSFGNKFVKTIIMWVFTVLPAYEILIFLDFWIVNLIEFWMGSNPVGASDIQHNPDGTILVQNGDDQFKLTPITETKFLVEHNGALVGEGVVTEDGQITLLDYATAREGSFQYNGELSTAM